MQTISVLGGPGSGKGTQCSLFKKKYHCTHISMGDLLRAETANVNSPYREVITENLRMGLLGSKEITTQIMQDGIEAAAKQGVQVIFLDGFPRSLDRALYFEELVHPISLVVVLDCPQDTLVARSLSRARQDDDEETIKSRVLTFETLTSEVVEKYETMGKLVRVQADASMEEVFAELQKALETAGIHLIKRSQQ